jgi:putative ABC transport system ATP-binding protein
VADEPTGDLDHNAALAIMELLQQLNNELHKTMIMVTHDPKTACYADQTLHLDKGKLVEAHVQDSQFSQPHKEQVVK